MADITWDNVVAFASELSTVDTEAQTDILAHVNSCLDVDNFGGEASGTLKLARIYLAAHMAALAARGSTGGVGPVTSESAGGLSRSYATSATTSSSGSGYEATPYGQAYLELVRTSLARMPLLG